MATERKDLPTVTIDVDYMGNKYPLRFHLLTPNASHTIYDGRPAIWHQMMLDGLSYDEADKLSKQLADEAAAKVRAQVRNGDRIE